MAWLIERVRQGRGAGSCTESDGKQDAIHPLILHACCLAGDEKKIIRQEKAAASYH
jgi:hypothetical protein